MGRELRRVPPNWDHPKESKPRFSRGRLEIIETYKPMYDQSCEEAWEKWQASFQKWLDGGHDEIIANYGAEEYQKDQPYTSFCKWHGQPPDPESYRPQWSPEEATWWQVYETVSEGAPVSPPFATQDELIEYLVANGDFWDQKRREEGVTDMECGPWSRKAAEKFVRGSGWAPSLVMDSRGIRSGVEAMADIEESNDASRQTAS